MNKISSDSPKNNNTEGHCTIWNLH